MVIDNSSSANFDLFNINFELKMVTCFGVTIAFSKTKYSRKKCNFTDKINLNIEEHTNDIHPLNFIYQGQTRQEIDDFLHNYHIFKTQI